MALDAKCPSLNELRLRSIWALTDQLYINLCKPSSSSVDQADLQMLPNLTSLAVSDTDGDEELTIKGVQLLVANRHHLDRFRKLKLLPSWFMRGHWDDVNREIMDKYEPCVTL